MARKKKEKDDEVTNSYDSMRMLHDIEKQELRAKLQDLNERYKHTLAALKESDERLNGVLALKDEIGDSTPKVFKAKTPGRIGESVACMVTSDWHLEERVDPKTVDGINEYSPQIAEARVKAFFANCVSVIEMCRNKSRIDTGVLFVLGDLITNMIHDDLVESNYLSPTEASLMAYRLCCGGIDFLLEHAGFKRLIVVCNYGNHGRTTKRPRCSTAAKQSYEWMIYHLLAERYAGNPAIEFVIADGYFAFVEIYDTVIRAHHGNGIKYQGGVGGVTIPLNKAIAQWNKMRKATIDVMGHWHTRQTARDHVLNGSIIGHNAYAIEIKASFEPPSQSFFLVHPKWGKTVECPVFVS